MPMKRILIIAALAIAVTSLALGRMTNRAGGQSGKIEQALMKTEQELVDALIRGDTAPFERAMADTFSFTAPDGSMQNRTQWLADMKSGALKMESSKNEDMKVQV